MKDHIANLRSEWNLQHIRGVMPFTQEDLMTATMAQVAHLKVPHPTELFVGSSWVSPSSDERVDVVTPIDGSIVASLPAVTVDDAKIAVAMAQEAFLNGPWATMEVGERIVVVERFLDLLEAGLEATNLAWVTEVGVPVTTAAAFGGGLTLAGRDSLRLARELPFVEERDTPGGRVVVRREALGPVLAVMTYNGPTTEIGLSVIPSLLVGNPVIVKLPPECRMVGHYLADAADQAGFPEGVISILTAETEVSKYLVAHDDVAGVHFTGGTEIGGEVAAVCGKRVARCTLELGGKSAAIVLDDADLDKTLPLLMVMTTLQGQVCNALTRVLVSRSRHDEVVVRLVEAFADVQIGDPRDPQTAFGPLPTERVRARSEGYIARAVAAGARVAAGGGRPAGWEQGFFLEPTLLVNVSNDMEVARSEIFGPVFCVIPYDDVDHAVSIANDSPFGLAGAVFTENNDQALEIAARVRVGTFWINAAAPCLTAPYGGQKATGHGRVGGPEGFFDLTALKQVVTG